MPYIYDPVAEGMDRLINTLERQKHPWRWMLRDLGRIVLVLGVWALYLICCLCVIVILCGGAWWVVQQVWR